MTIQFTKAARHAVKLKIGIDGPSGSGKTMGALALAKGITNGGRVALADSENRSASLYADRYEFDTVPITNADPASITEIINAAVDAGYDALVIDSLSHTWQAVLNAKDDHDRANPRSNQWTNWRVFGPKWDKLVKHVLDAPIHIIATMRSKQGYEQVEQNGSKKVVKLGLQPQVRDGTEYEFSIVFSVNIAHYAEATKDRTGLYAGETLDLCDPKLHKGLVAWMNAGGPMVESPKAVRDVEPSLKYKVGDRKMEELQDDELSRYIDSRSGEPRFVDRVEAARALLDYRKTHRSPEDALAKVQREIEAEEADLPFPALSKS